MDFSLWQIAIVLVIALIVFGPKRLPELGKSLGTGMREFKDSISGKHEEEEKPSIEKASQTEKVDSEVVTENKA
jgi:sec-independent protein translocase protein TatA